MAEFSWEATGKNGEVKRGTMVAEDEGIVRTKLRGQQLQVVKMQKKPANIALKMDFQFGTGVTGVDVVTFTRLLATMIDAGMPIVQCLDILGSQTENKHFGKIVKDIRTTVEGGSTFSAALRRHPKVFDNLYTNLVQAGEEGGKLNEVLTRLAEHREKAMKTARKVKGAMVYPSIVLVIFLGVLAVLLGWVVPSFESTFKEMDPKGDGLPWLTQQVANVSRAFVSNFGWIVLFIVVSIVSFVLFYRTPAGKKKCHAWFLKAPVFGDLIRKVAVARFTRTMSTMLTAGVPILDSLEIVSRTVGNVIIEEAILHTRAKVSEGRNIAEPLTESGVFPPMVVQMIGVGEQTGTLDVMLKKIADFYEEEVDTAVDAMTSLIEPAMMVGIGGTVGVVLIAMYLPIFGMAGKFKA